MKCNSTCMTSINAYCTAHNKKNPIFCLCYVGSWIFIWLTVQVFYSFNKNVKSSPVTFHICSFWYDFVLFFIVKVTMFFAIIVSIENQRLILLMSRNTRNIFLFYCHGFPGNWVKMQFPQIFCLYKNLTPVNILKYL